eukprot:TRINITY_DN60537_c0_g1_i1.p1 TRINITY_DN60537_c0_g1~~TRINITY_DN60537_c0_g1_i1.p1  ORF type:complete len:320 (+),score=60.19 TRINITY_DN60537_c0_g1_i1:57-1016(+)
MASPSSLPASTPCTEAMTRPGQPVLQKPKFIDICPTQHATEMTTVAILLHGFGSSRDEVSGVYARLAGALAEAGIASLRLDFRGYGENDDLRTQEATVETMVKDARDALEYVKEAWISVDGDATAEETKGCCQSRRLKVVLVGFSLGALVASRVLAEDDGGSVAAFVALSPVNDGFKDLTGGLDASLLQQAGISELLERLPNLKVLQEGTPAEDVLEFDLGFRSIILSPTFFEVLARCPTTAASIRAYHGRVLLIAGTLDWSHANSQQIQAAHSRGNTKFIPLPNANHVFNCFDEATSRVSDVIDEVVRFLSDVHNDMD